MILSREPQITAENRPVQFQIPHPPPAIPREALANVIIDRPPFPLPQAPRGDTGKG